MGMYLLLVACLITGYIAEDIVIEFSPQENQTIEYLKQEIATLENEVRGIISGDIPLPDTEWGLPGSPGQRGPKGENGDDFNIHSPLVTYVLANIQELTTLTNYLNTVATGLERDLHEINGYLINATRNGNIATELKAMLQDLNNEIDVHINAFNENMFVPEVPLFKGIKGYSGLTGIPGLIGRPGPKGYRGERGEPGLGGHKGVRGDDGMNGLPGIPGRDGHKGGHGQPGIPGRDGIRGIKGERGSPGFPGPPGAI